MKTLALSLLCLALSLSFGQSSVPSYHSYQDFLLAPPGALKYGLYGFENPASLTPLRHPDLVFVWSDMAGPANNFNRWGLFAAMPSYGFGMIHQKTARGSVTDFRISAASGNRSFSLGIGYGWSSGDEAHFDRTSLLTIGSLFRPTPHLSLGLFGTASLSKGDQEAVADIAVRPMVNERLTLFADYALRSQQSVNRGTWSAGAVVEALPGIRITGRTFDTKAFTVGLQLSLGHIGLSTQSHYHQDGQHRFNTYAARFGAYDRNVFDSYLNRNKNYVELNLIGNIGYQRFQFFDNTRTLKNLLEVIDAVQDDPRIAGIAINTSGMNADREKLWELREKLLKLKSSGKRVIVFIDRGGIDLYHFASVADKIVMDPTGMFLLEGYLMGRTYVKGTLEKLGVGYDEWRFFKYKSANEGFAREQMSEADREQRQKLVDEYYRVARADICAARNVSPAQFDTLVNEKVIILPLQAMELGLVDTLGRWEALKTTIKNLDGKEKPFLSMGAMTKYQLPYDNRWGEPPKIAVIYALGVCAMDEGITARRLVKDVEAAVESKSIKAIVLRVDSPGGDAMASDYIADALRKAKGKKPIIVSQGYVAASGGYWLSMYADTIVAAPTTITGSIGVIGGWMYNKSLKEKLGLTTDHVKAGAHADLGFGFTLPLINVGLPDRALTPEERSAAENSIKSLYKEFVEKVAWGRKSAFDRIDSIAQGRVWSGADGKQRGLVDVLGGLEAAIEIAKEKAGIEKRMEVGIVELPSKGLIDFSALMPRLIGLEERGEKNDILEMLRFRLKHNGQPLPMLPLEDIEIWEY